MVHPEIPHPEESADTCYLFEGDADVSTLAGLDDDLDLEQNHSGSQGDSLLDGNDLSRLTPNLTSSSAGFLCHTSAHPNFSWVCPLDVALDQPVLDLDSDGNDGEEEMVLDF